MNQKQVVEEILKIHPEARNSDQWLIYWFIKHYCPRIYIPFEEIKKIPNPCNAQKLRQIIQNKEGKYLPNPRVMKLRDNAGEKDKIYFQPEYSVFDEITKLNTQPSTQAF